LGFSWQIYTWRKSAERLNISIDVPYVYDAGTCYKWSFVLRLHNTGRKSISITRYWIEAQSTYLNEQEQSKPYKHYSNTFNANLPREAGGNPVLIIGPGECHQAHIKLDLCGPTTMRVFAEDVRGRIYGSKDIPLSVPSAKPSFYREV
jgi:hypothetical protein